MSPDLLLLQKISELYQKVGKIESSEKVAGGYLSQNYILQTNGDKFFLKQYRFDNVEKIKEIHRVKFFFSKGNIPIVLPIKNNESETFFQHEGKYYALFPFVEGMVIQKKDRTLRAFESAGEILAHIHLLSKNGFPDIVSSRVKGWEKKLFLRDASRIREKIMALPMQSDFDRLALSTLACKTAIASENTIVWEDLHLPNNHLLHGDFHGQNMFFDETDEVKYVFDLEKAEVGPRAPELVRALDYLCFAGRIRSNDFTNGRAMLGAYNSVYSISNDELIRGIRAFYLKKAHSLWVEGEHYDKGNSRVDGFLEMELDTLQYFSKHFDEFVEKLLS